MNKLITVVLLLVCSLTLSACNREENEDILHLGINAEIVKTDVEKDVTNQCIVF